MSRLLQDYVTRAAERHPDKVAVVMGDERLTYGELELQSNRLARLLAENGCHRGDRVCLLLGKSPSAITAMIAILKADAAYVPIDVSSPAPRVARIVSASEPRLMLACGETAKLADELAAEDALSWEWASVSSTTPAAASRSIRCSAEPTGRSRMGAR